MFLKTRRMFHSHGGYLELLLQNAHGWNGLVLKSYHISWRDIFVKQFHILCRMREQMLSGCLEQTLHDLRKHKRHISVRKASADFPSHKRRASAQECWWVSFPPMNYLHNISIGLRSGFLPERLVRPALLSPCMTHFLFQFLQRFFRIHRSN